MSDPRLIARLWLAGVDLDGRRGGHDAAFLWLHLADRRVLAFRLFADYLDDDRVLAPLLDAIAKDARGVALGHFHPAFREAVPLYNVPAAPVPECAWGHPKHVEARAFNAGLDQEILALVAALDTHRVWSSARNYTRLAALPSALKARRMQAIARFPVLVAPVLLSAHQGHDYSGGKRHAWRAHDDAIIDAIDLGRDLVGTLARHYGVSKSLVRAPLCSAMWGEHGVSHRDLLRLLDGVPAHVRPTSVHGLERYTRFLPALYGLFPNGCDARELGALVFKTGFENVWRACEAAHPELGHALVDSRDFLRAATARATELAPSQHFDPERLARLWLARRSLKPLLDASHRWHDHHAACPHHGDDTALLPLLGHWQDAAGHSAREILTHADLVAEGAAMHHCVADYWEQCVTAATRIFHLAAPDGARATAAYQCVGLRDANPYFSLLQLRGPCNASVGHALDAFARALWAELNAPEHARARVAQAAQARGLRATHTPRPNAAAPLDPASERELARLLRSAQSHSTTPCEPACVPLSRPGEGLARALRSFYRRRDFFASHPVHANGHRPCPACGYPTLPGEGRHDTCPVCLWEDEGLDDYDAGVPSSGCNGHSLVVARINFAGTRCIWAHDDIDTLHDDDAERLFSPAARARQRRLCARYDALRCLRAPFDIARQWTRIDAHKTAPQGSRTEEG